MWKHIHAKKYTQYPQCASLARGNGIIPVKYWRIIVQMHSYITSGQIHNNFLSAFWLLTCQNFIHHGTILQLLVCFRNMGAPNYKNIFIIGKPLFLIRFVWLGHLFFQIKSWHFQTLISLETKIRQVSTILWKNGNL